MGTLFVSLGAGGGNKAWCLSHRPHGHSKALLTTILLLNLPLPWEDKWMSPFAQGGAGTTHSIPLPRAKVPLSAQTSAHTGPASPAKVSTPTPQVHYSLHIPQRERETHHSPLHQCPGLCVFSCGLGREALSKALSLVGGRGKFVCSSAWRVSQSKAKGSFFSLQISLWRGKVHLCNTSLPTYSAHQDHYVGSLLCTGGNGKNSTGLSRNDPTPGLVGSGPVKFQGVWNGVPDVGQRSKTHAPYLCLLCITPLFWRSQLMWKEERKTPQQSPALPQTQAPIQPHHVPAIARTHIQTYKDSCAGFIPPTSVCECYFPPIPASQLLPHISGALTLLCPPHSVSHLFLPQHFLLTLLCAYAATTGRFLLLTVIFVPKP